MTFTKLVVALACLISGTLVAQDDKVTELMSKNLTSCPGKEGLMITAEYPPSSKNRSIATMHTGLFMCSKAPS